MFRNSSQWYHDRGVPYRRGYLLHGPPGTGKTSFIVALASHLSMSVCIVNLGISGLNDQQLDQLLNNAPRNSILLMEDVDAALIKRKAGKSQGGSNNVTLSGILNALDGITAQEGSVVFMTTNHIRKLAPALIRPGRCDRRMLFDYADRHQIHGMFLKFFLSRSPTASANKDSKTLPKSFFNSVKAEAEDAAAAAAEAEAGFKEKARRDVYDAMIHELADKICEKITKEDEVTPAQLQGFFMLHRDDPENIIEKVPEFLAELIREREEAQTKKEQRRQRRAKKKAKKAESDKKAKEARVAAGEPSEDEDDEDEDEDEGSDTDSDSDDEDVKGANGSALPNGSAIKGTVDVEADGAAATAATAATAV